MFGTEFIYCIIACNCMRERHVSIRNHCCVSVREAGSYALAQASFLSTPLRSRERALEKADYLQGENWLFSHQGVNFIN